jgi:hypothetical protein
VDLIEYEMFLGEPGDEDTPARRAEIDRDDACRSGGRHVAIPTSAAGGAIDRIPLERPRRVTGEYCDGPDSFALANPPVIVS